MAQLQITRPDGAVIAHKAQGTGPPVLLIQGVGVVGDGWRPQVDGLADRFTCITFDNRGMGRSTVGKTPQAPAYSVEVLAADALAIMDAHGFDRFHVAGHSLGGCIAQELALGAPGRVLSLAFLCTFHRGRDGAVLTFDMLIRGLRTRIGTRAMRRNAFLELVLPPKALAGRNRAELAARLEPLFGHDLADQPAIVLEQLKALSRYDARERFHQLERIPTLVVSATKDRIAKPASGRALADAIPGAKYVQIDDAGHGLPIQAPDRVNALLAEFWKGTG
jgi:pimeloyl-ACP methyl ester carboxylesterase